jgi:hypothetical protein
MESEKYNKILRLLRESKPVLDSTEDIEREVLRRISKKHKSVLNVSDLIETLFGWIYIGWVRRTLITASVLLVVVFIYQQGVMLKQINFLSRQISVPDREIQFSTDQQAEKLLIRYKKASRAFPPRSITISEKQMKELNEYMTKYKDLEKLIEEDPELKQLIENKLIENNRKKSKI